MDQRNHYVPLPGDCQTALRRCSYSGRNQMSRIKLRESFILDVSSWRGVNDSSAKPFVSRVVPAEREHVGASNEEAAGSIDFYFVDPYRQALCWLLHRFLRYRPFRLSTLDYVRRAESFKCIWLWGTRALQAAVIPAKAGIHSANLRESAVNALDSRFRGNDRRFKRGPVPNDTNSQRRKLQSLGCITVSCIDILFWGFSSATQNLAETLSLTQSWT